MNRTHNPTVSAATADDLSVVTPATTLRGATLHLATRTATTTAPQQLCDRCHHDLNAELSTDLGFGYSREPDTTARPEPVPAGVDTYSFTGRSPQRAAA